MEIKNYQILKENSLDRLDPVGAMTAKADSLSSSLKRTTGLSTKSGSNGNLSDDEMAKDEEGFTKEYFIFTVASNSKKYGKKFLKIGREDEQYFYKISDKVLIVKRNDKQYITIHFPIQIKKMEKGIMYTFKFLNNVGFTRDIPNGKSQDFNDFTLIFPKQI